MSTCFAFVLLVAAATAAPFLGNNATKPLFEGSVGANCPPCKEFGQHTLGKLYKADGIAASVDFIMHSAIRSPKAPTKASQWDCPDEDAGCPMTRWFLCAVDGWNETSTTQDQRLNFLSCWDDANPETVDKAEQAAKKCSKSVGFDFDAISSCNSGAKGLDLQLVAAEWFEKRFPTHAHSGIFGVPHIFINGKELTYGKLDYDSVLKELCATGIKAGACNQIA